MTPVFIGDAYVYISRSRNGARTYEPDRQHEVGDGNGKQPFYGGSNWFTAIFSSRPVRL